MHYISYKQRRFIRWLLLSLLTLALAACSTTSPPQLDTPETPSDFAYVAKADIAEGMTQAEVEAIYGGTSIIFKPEAGFAVLGFSEDQAQLTTLSTDSNQGTIKAPEVSAQGWDAWAGGWDAWAGGWDAWAGGWDAWAGGWDAWAGGHGAWSGGHGAWSGGISSSATLSGNLSAWEQINLAEGQRLAPNLGAGVKVAVIDSGIALEHPAFAGKLAPSNEWRDFIGPYANFPNDHWTSGGNNKSYGHGTGVAGIILQVAPETTILPIRVLNSDGSGDVDDVVLALDWAVQKGADVVNLSLGTDEDVAALQAMVDYVASQGVYVITSAGNSGNTNITYPARQAKTGSYKKYIISVGSIDKSNKKSSFSNYGSELELLAPGEKVYTLSPYRETNGPSTGSYGKGHTSGTSFAAPMVSGTIALALGESPSATQQNTLEYKLLSSAANVDSLNPNFAGVLGDGRLDIEAFLKGMGYSAPAPSKEALFIVGSLPYNAGDAAFANRLERLGFRVTTYADTSASAGQASGKDVVVISASVNEATVAATFRDVAVPVVTFEEKIFDDMKMASSLGNDSGLTHIQIANHSDQIAVFENGNKVAWGIPSSSATVLATLTYDNNKATIFSYEAGSQMVGMTAPAKRVGLFHNYYGAQHTAEGWAFFDAAVIWAVTDTSGSSAPVATSSLEVRVSRSSDDAEEQSGGRMYLNSSDLELVDDGYYGHQQVGLRFQNVAIPRGATITAAYIEFETDELDSRSTSLTVRGEATNSAATFTSQSYNLSSRATTSALVAWNNVAAWDQYSEKHQTPNLASVVQEIIDRGGWSPGNNMAFIITGSGERTAESYDGESENAPLLRVEYTQ